MSKVVEIVCIHVTVAILLCPPLLSRLGSGFVFLANVVGRVGPRLADRVRVHECEDESALPPARVVIRSR